MDKKRYQWASIYTLLREALGGRIIIIMFGSIWSSALSLSSAALLVRIHGKESFGQIAFIQALIVSVGGVIGLGIGSLGMRLGAQISVKPSDDARIELYKLTKVIKILSILLVIVTLLCKSVAGPSSPLAKIDSIMYLFMGASLYFYSMDSYYRTTLLGLGNYKSYSLIPIIGYVPYFVIIINNQHDINIVAAGWFAMCVTNFAFSATLYRRRAETKMREADSVSSIRGGKIFRGDWVAVVLSSALVAPVQWLANFLMARDSGNFQASATFAIAMQWFALLSFAPNSVARAYGPKITAKYFENSKKELKAQLKLLLVVSVAFLLPPSILMYFFKSEMVIFYGNSIKDDIYVLDFVILASFSAVLASPVGYLLLAAKRNWLGAGMNAIWAGTFLAGTYFGASRGASWVLASMAVAYILHAVIAWMAVAPKLFKSMHDYDSRIQ